MGFLKPSTRQPTVFFPQVSYGSDLLLPLVLFPRIKAPPEIASPRTPKTIPDAELQVRAKAQHHLGSLSTVYGLTDVDVSVWFEDPVPGSLLGLNLGRTPQWVMDESGRWQFQGGTIYLEAKITVFINENHKNYRYADELFDMIMSHELEHVKDEEDIMKSLPNLLSRDPTLRKLLIDNGSGEPDKLLDPTFQHWFIDKMTDLGRQMTHFEHWVLHTWADEHNKREKKRDSGPRYAQYQNNISNLQNGLLQYVVWPK
jgi:hypothetical protein